MNLLKTTLCPGPGAALPEWKLAQKEFFGRGDAEYNKIKAKTTLWLKKISGKKNIVGIPGSATTAAYIAFQNFLNKKILIIENGYYSQRWVKLCQDLMGKNNISVCKFNQIQKIKKKFNWIVFVYVETSSCKIYDISKVYDLKKKTKAKIMLDATASIGLEKNNNIADVMFFSSCKGLLGPTGMGFICFDEKKNVKKNKNFFLNLETYINSKYTMGYNCLSTLYLISKKHKKYLSRIKYARKLLIKFSKNTKNPIIGIDLNFKIKKKLKKIIYYQPRAKGANQLIFFLGFAKYNFVKIKKILEKILSKKL